MYKILINLVNGKVLACGTSIVHNPDDVSYLIDNEYGIGVHPNGEYSIVEVETYLQPEKYLFKDGVIIENPAYVQNDVERQMKIMQLALDELILKGAL